MTKPASRISLATPLLAHLTLNVLLEVTPRSTVGLATISVDMGYLLRKQSLSLSGKRSVAPATEAALLNLKTLHTAFTR